MYIGSDNMNYAIDNGRQMQPVIEFDGITIENVSSLSYYGGSNNSDDIAIGTTNMAYIECETTESAYNITGKEILLKEAVKLPDGTTEYVPMGYFTVKSIDGDIDGTAFTAVDRMHRFEKLYFSSLQYPSDSAKVLNELCTMCGVELATPITSPIAITENLKGYTCREVLGYIAGIHGFFACFDRYGKLNLRWYSKTPIEKQIGLIWSLTKSQSDYTVGKITLAKDEETTYTSGSGVTGVKQSNPYATQTITDSIYASLGGFTYRPCKISMLDDVRLDPWDIIKVTYLDGTDLLIPVMYAVHNFASGETIVESYGKTESENEYEYAGPLTKTLDRTVSELLVVNRVVATKVDAEWVKANTVSAEELSATNARITILETTSLTTAQADIKYATIANLNTQIARIDSLAATSLTADSAVIKALTSEVSDINTLIFGSASGTVIQTEFSNSVIAQLGEAQIKSAMIESVSASKITAGEIYTSLVKIYGDSNKRLVIADNTIQLSDDSDIVRMQMGEDASGRYNIIIRNSSEEVIFDAVGVTEKGYHSGSIKNIAVADNANISAGKLNIDSLFSVINDDSLHTLKSSKIYLDSEAQTLDVAFSTMTTNVANVTNTAISQGTQISAIQGQINSKIWQSDITTAVNNSEPLIMGTQTAVTGAWTGIAPFSELKDGQRITYWLPFSGNGNATLNLTLSGGNTTGAIPCYYGGSTRITTHYPAGNAIRLTYRKDAKIGSGTYTGWWADANYDSNTYDKIRYNVAIKAVSAIVYGNLIVGDSSGYHHLKTGESFDITNPILYANSSVSAGTTTTQGYINIAMSIKTTQTLTLVANKSLYIKGTLSGSTFTPISTAPITQDIPTSEDGYDYILLGTAYSTTNFYLISEHPIYRYINGIFQQISSGALQKTILQDGKIEELTTRYTEVKQSVDGISATVASHTTQIASKADNSTVTAVDNKITSLTADVNMFKTEVSNTYTTKAEFDKLEIGGRNLAIYDNIVQFGAGNMDKSHFIDSGTIIRNDVSTNGGFRFDSKSCYEPNTNYALECYMTVLSGTLVNFRLLSGKTSNFISFTVDGTKYGNPLLAGFTEINDVLNDGERHHLVIRYATSATIPEDTGYQYTYFQPNSANATPIEYKLEGFCLRSGDKALGWSPAPEDTEAEITSISTIATQTADKFNWLVASGTSSTDFTLTDRVASLLSAQFNIDALTTFKNSAESGTSTVIDGGAIKANSIKANSIDVANLFSQNITATGTITGGTLSGTKLIAATAEIGAGSTIGGFSVWGDSINNGTALSNTKDNNSTGMGKQGGNWGFWAGNGRFSVTQDGYLYAESGVIGGVELSANAMIAGDITLSNNSEVINNIAVPGTRANTVKINRNGFTFYENDTQVGKAVPWNLVYAMNN